MWVEGAGGGSTPGGPTEYYITRPVRFACWVTKATNAHLEYIVPIYFLRQQWLRERVSILRYTYNAVVVII